MTRKERYQYILDYFRKTTPIVTTELESGSVFQLLVTILLSAQCTDKRINQVTPTLSQRYPDARSVAQAAPEEVLEYVRSMSYPNAKSRHLVEMAQMLVSGFGGEVPDNTADLVRLPDVGRRMANVMQAVWYGKAKIAVDTHVCRVSYRMGLVPQEVNTPLKVEPELVKYIPEEGVSSAHHWLFLHGRYVYQSQRPKCEKCQFEQICPKRLTSSKLA